MKNLLLIFSVLLSTSLSAVEYGYFHRIGDAIYSETISIPAGNKLRTINHETNNHGFDGDDNIVVIKNGIEYKKRYGGSYHRSFKNITIYGPCDIKLEFNTSGNRYLPYEISPILEDSTSNKIIIPANQNIESTDLLIQYSEDTISWSNISAGAISQTNNPKFYRLVLENPNNSIQLANINFGFGETNPSTVSYNSIEMPITLPEEGLLLNINEGEIFKPLNGSFNSNTFHIYLKNQHYDKQFVFEYYSGGSLTGECVVEGPAELLYRREGGNMNNCLLNYTITTQLEQSRLSGNVITIPAGNSSYSLKIQYSEDLSADWIDLQNGADINSSNLRFYRLTAVAE